MIIQADGGREGRRDEEGVGRLGRKEKVSIMNVEKIDEYFNDKAFKGPVWKIWLKL